MILDIVANRTRAILRRKPPAFLHIPKTGGTYVMQLESTTGPVLEGVKYLGHSYVIDGEGEINPIYWHNRDHSRQSTVPRALAEGCFVFSTVRNIFSWLVSYAGHAGGANPRYRSTGHYDHDFAQKGFDYLLKVIANREDQWPNRKLINCQLFSSGADLIADHLNRQETLDDDLADMAGSLGVSYRRKSKQRLGAQKDYRLYYTDELIELVNNTWNRELDLFGYTFDGCDLRRAVIPRSVSPELKKSLKYCWKQDQLTLAGQPLPRR